MAKLKRKAKSGAHASIAARDVQKLGSKVPAAGRKVSRAYDVAGVTKDGVFIIRAKARPKHFTSEQIRRSIAEVEKSSSKG
jgi:hypothetical protein